MNNKLLIGIIILVIVLGGGYFAAKTIKHAVAPAPAPVVQQQVMSTPTQAMTSQMTLALTAENNSGESGTAVLKETDGKVTVTIMVTGFPSNPQPAHIHVGACPGVGAVKYPLTNVVNGQSVTTLPVTLAQLKQQLPLAINLHESAANITTYTSCGALSNQ